MKLSELLEEFLQQWLESEDGRCINEAYGVDGYVCVQNFINYVKEQEMLYGDRDSD